MKSGGNVENNTTTGQNSKKRDFENIRFRKIVKKSNKNNVIKFVIVVANAAPMIPNFFIKK